jgi:hypothetical protein
MISLFSVDSTVNLILGRFKIGDSGLFKDQVALIDSIYFGTQLDLAKLRREESLLINLHIR